MSETQQRDSSVVPAASEPSSAGNMLRFLESTLAEVSVQMRSKHMEFAGCALLPFSITTHSENDS